MEAALRIDGERLWVDLQELGGIGRGERGVSRLAFSPADMEGRRWLLARMSGAGLSSSMDAVGNVFGSLDAGSGDVPAILVGSHCDTVPEGGTFDGALGVISGLEVARAIREAGYRLRHPLQVVAFANEEGSRIIPGTFGSRSFIGRVSPAEWARVAPVLAEAGLGGGAQPSPAFSPDRYRCYLELHIEQGGVLDASGEDIGVVTGIVSIVSFTATFKGEPNHAGTTPMDQRKDALLGASELVLAIPDAVKRLGSPATVGTCGQMRVQPGGRNVIPGEATMSVEVRDLDQAVADRVLNSLRETAAEIAKRRGLGLDLGGVSLNKGALMDGRMQDIIESSARVLGLSSRRMPSGAGHDAMNLAPLVPTGMIFVPSKAGVSHSPKEWTSKEQCATGAEVLLRTVLAVDRA